MANPQGQQTHLLTTDPGAVFSSERLNSHKLQTQTFTARSSKPNSKSKKAPKTPGIALTSASDSGVLGDGRTTAATVTLTGQTSKQAIVKLRGFGKTVADDSGKFQFENVPLNLGKNSLQVVARRAGSPKGTVNGKSLFATKIKRVSEEAIDPVVEWNAVALRAIATSAGSPPASTRNLAILHTAVFDAVNNIQGGYNSYKIKSTAPAGASAEAAAVGAAYQTLVKLYPKLKDTFDTALTQSLARITDGQAETDGLAYGKSVADAMVALRSSDGSTTKVTYQADSTVGRWKPTAPEYKPAALPQWQNLLCFSMSSSDQFRPSAPAELTSAKYAREINEVKAVGRKNSRSRTADQTEIAKFWADEAGTYTPPGHWNQIAQQVANQQGGSLLDNARTFALLNVATADAAVVAWDCKYSYSRWRPIDAIREADTDGNRATKAQKGWTPLITTPNHPDYTSGHSTFSAAASEVLTEVYGRKFAFSTNSVGYVGVTRSFKSFKAAAAEAGESRIYGGIHTRSANEAGLRSGDALGKYVVQNFMTPIG
jgi:hypothetical protein